MPFEDGIKTVSGSVVNFTDGAAKVGCDSVVATISASISGTNTAKVTHIPSNNVLCLPTADVTINSMRFYTVNGVMYLNGTQSATISSLHEDFKAFDFWLPKGTYYFQRGSIALATYIRTYDDMAEFQVNNGSFTLTEPTHLYVSFYMANKSYTNAKADLCIKVGSTSFGYADYEDTAPKREYTANLGRTVHYATADVAKGTGKDYSKTVKLSSFTWDYVTDEYSYGYFVRSGNITDMTTNMNFACTNYVNNGNPRSSIADGEIGVYNKGNAIRRPVIRDDSCSSLEQFLEKIADYDFVYECTGTPTDFTFTGQTIESEFCGNTMWNNGGGDISVTYHDNTHGFATINVNRLQSKNLFDKAHANVVVGYITATAYSSGSSNARTIYISIKANTTYTISRRAGQRFWVATSPVIPTNGALYTGRQVNNTATSITITSGENDRYLWAYIYLNGTDTDTLQEVLDSVQIEYGSSPSAYEAYSGVAKTAYLHKIVYGGQADVVKGTCEPKNILLPSSTDSASTVVNGVTRSYSLDSQTWTLEGSNTKTDANWLIYNGANYVLSKALVVGDTYTYSHTLSANCYSQFTYKNTNGATRALGYLIGNANKNASVTFTVPSDFVELLRFQIGVIKTATSVSEEAVFQLEKASSKTEYAPYFDPFTFPPISMETDEGENTLYADEGDSAITYRKAVD